MEEVQPRPTPPADPLDLDDDDYHDYHDVGGLLELEDDDDDCSKKHLDFVLPTQKKTKQKSPRMLKFIFSDQRKVLQIDGRDNVQSDTAQTCSVGTFCKQSCFFQFWTCSQVLVN